MEAAAEWLPDFGFCAARCLSRLELLLFIDFARTDVISHEIGKGVMNVTGSGGQM